MVIRILNDEVASQIAAGEVVERPASVVKELIENSIDAGATSVQIKLEEAGKKLIEVSDDGCGIPSSEIPLAVSRHATSKLTTAADLFSIHTLGFRGEALASICSVSRTTITSRFEEEKTGSKLVVEGGKAGELQKVGVPRGTVVKVEQLFYNVPARLKFLKSDRTEKRLINELVTKYALVYSDIRFSLRYDKKDVLRTSGGADKREVLSHLFGIENAKKLIPVLNIDDDISISGFISPTSVTRSNRKGIHIFVNGRPIHDIALVTSMINAYHTLLMVGRYPFGVIFLEMPTEMVDINVHPTKYEVRFREKDRVFRSVGRAVRKALLASSPIPEASINNWDSSGRKGDAFAGGVGLLGNESLIGPSWWFQGRVGKPGTGSDKFTSPSGGIRQEEFEKMRSPLLRLVGQIASTYIVAEGPDGLYLIDQHAAHERILFEKFIEQKNGIIPSQRLLQPVTIQLTAPEAAEIQEKLSIINKLGFDIEPFGHNTYVIRAIPSLLFGMQPETAVRVLVEDFEEDEIPLQNEIEAKIIARICKSVAVKGGQTLSTAEQQQLLLDLEKCESPRTCPHGRPTMIHLSVDLLERQFGRKGAK